jgi:hypothetical protein
MEAARSVAEFEKEGSCGVAVDLRWFRGRRHACELVLRTVEPNHASTIFVFHYFDLTTLKGVKRTVYSEG